MPIACFYLREAATGANSPGVSIPAESSIGKGLVFNGEITGIEPLFLDGKVEGSANLPGSRVTVGANGQANATISALEFVTLGKIRGDVSARPRTPNRKHWNFSARSLRSDSGTIPRSGQSVWRST